MSLKIDIWQGYQEISIVFKKLWFKSLIRDLVVLQSPSWEEFEEILMAFNNPRYKVSIFLEGGHFVKISIGLEMGPRDSWLKIGKKKKLHVWQGP